MILYTCATVILSIIAYAIVEVLLKNEILTEIWVALKRKVTRK